MSDYMLNVDDVIRFQLSPDGNQFRYWWTPDAGWQDSGYGGQWTDGLVVATFYDKRGFAGWDPEPLAIIYYDDLDGYEQRMHLPLPGHPAFDESMLIRQGYPQPPRKLLPKCDCGSSGKDSTHYHWCSRRQAAEAMDLHVY